MQQDNPNYTSQVFLTIKFNSPGIELCGGGLKNRLWREQLIFTSVRTVGGMFKGWCRWRRPLELKEGLTNSNPLLSSCPGRINQKMNRQDARHARVHCNPIGLSQEIKKTSKFMRTRGVCSPISSLSLIYCNCFSCNDIPVSDRNKKKLFLCCLSRSRRINGVAPKIFAFGN